MLHILYVIGIAGSVVLYGLYSREAEGEPEAKLLYESIKHVPTLLYVLYLS